MKKKYSRKRQMIVERLNDLFGKIVQFTDDSLHIQKTLSGMIGKTNYKTPVAVRDITNILRKLGKMEEKVEEIVEKLQHFIKQILMRKKLRWDVEIVETDSCATLRIKPVEDKKTKGEQASAI